jgi:serine/threonine-protein kinase
MANLERALSRPMPDTVTLEHRPGGTGGEPPSLPPRLHRPARPNDSPRYFTVLCRLGKGGNGLVLKAFDHLYQRVVALKIALPRAKIARVKREARALMRLDHPGIARIYEVLDPRVVRLKHLQGDESQQITALLGVGLCVLVMEFVDGMSLDKIRNLTPEESVAIIIQACAALQAAHDQGLVHRDVKRANLMRTGDGKVVKVIDFGLVKWPEGVPISFSDDMLGTHEALVTSNGDILGSPECMAPELADGRGYRADPRTDVYCLGATLYRMLTGRNQFEGNLRQVLAQLWIGKEPIPPRARNKKIPKALEAIVLKAMAKDPANRYQSAAALAGDLRRWIDGGTHKADSRRAIGATLRSWVSRMSSILS